MIKKRFHFFFSSQNFGVKTPNKGSTTNHCIRRHQKIVHHPAWHGQYTHTNLASKLALDFHQTELADYMKVVLIVIVHL